MATPPSILRVPLPAGNFGREYGVNSVRHESAERITFRIRQSHRELIVQAARILEMTEAQFVRDAAVNMAKVILKHAEMGNVPDEDDRSR